MESIESKAEQLIGSDKAGAQKFFADLAVESRKPHFGEHEKNFTRSLLIRAQEANLYTPEQT